jgi:hypothetical protein
MVDHLFPDFDNFLHRLIEHLDASQSRIFDLCVQSGRAKSSSPALQRPEAPLNTKLGEGCRAAFAFSADDDFGSSCRSPALRSLRLEAKWRVHFGTRL